MDQKESTLFNVLNGFRTEQNQSFEDLSAAAPVLLVFLRHLSCPFCQRLLHELRELQDDIQKQGLVTVLVHMADEEAAQKVFEYYGLANIPHFRDPERRLYRAVGLKNVPFRNVLSPRVMLRGMNLKRELDGPAPAGSGSRLQMPGLFLVDQGHIVAGHSLIDVDEPVDLRGLLSGQQTT